MSKLNCFIIVIILYQVIVDELISKECYDLWHVYFNRMLVFCTYTIRLDF